MKSADLLMRLAPWLVVSAAVVTFGWGPMRIFAHIDDAFIAYRYAANLAHGDGLSFNVGEHVEGFSSLAWVLLVAVGVRFGLDAPFVSHVLALASGAAALVVTDAYARATLPERYRLVAGVAPWILLSSTSFGVWATSGLETPLFVAVATLALYFDLKARPTAAAVASVLATLVRPDGVLVAAVVLASGVLRGGPKRIRSWAPALAYAAFLAALTAFRLAYFGVPLPNTFYAKVGGVAWVLTANYVASFAVQVFAPLALPFTVGALREPRLRTGAAWCGVVLAYVLVVGADFAEHARFFLPALPAIIGIAVHGAVESFEARTFRDRLTVGCLPVTVVWYLAGPLSGACAFVAVLVVAAVERPQKMPSWAGAAIVAAVASGAGARVVWHEEPRLPRWLGGTFAPRIVFTRAAEVERLRATAENLTIGAFMTNDRLNRRRPVVQSIAAPGIGALGYASSRRIIDIFGLTDPVIARTDPPRELSRRTMPLAGHQRSNAAYVLAQKPDCILIPREPTAIPIPAHIELLLSQALWRSYAWDSSVGAYCRLKP